MALELTALGHAGFCVETAEAIIIMDPWVSPMGAFDAAWFQFPCNHHMAAFVQEKLQDTDKKRYIYVSHEHKDHFDPVFLGSLQTSDFTFVVPWFRRTELYESLQRYPSNGILRCRDGEEIPIPGGSVVLYLDDSEMDRDSSILVKADGHTFLNMNDCKIHDRISDIVNRHGPIDVFTAQFSGAVWHPVCYEYPKKVYEAISTRKMMSKFEAVARAMEAMKPKVYLTSAGPACFLDPMLMHLNFERVNIFPRAPKFLKYLEKRLKGMDTQFYEPMPGDQLDVATLSWLYRSPERVTDDNVEAYIRAYAARYDTFFRSRRDLSGKANRADVLDRLRVVLAEKLEMLTLRDRVHIPLYFRLADEADKMIRVDFPGKRVEFATEIPESHYYSITTPSWEIERVLDGRLTWEDFTLTLRMRLNRDPDVYHIVIHGFLMMEKDDMNWFCAKVLDAESRNERILVEANGRRYSINRYCPHQGADLTHGWIEDGHYLVCPRHRWKYDLENGGQCTTCDISVRAFIVEDN